MHSLDFANKWKSCVCDRFRCWNSVHGELQYGGLMHATKQGQPRRPKQLKVFRFLQQSRLLLSRACKWNYNVKVNDRNSSPVQTGLYLRVQVLSTASMRFRVFWWWRQYTPLKRRSTPMRLHGATSQKTLNLRALSLRQHLQTGPGSLPVLS
jgi:hypothetical protein